MNQSTSFGSTGSSNDTLSKLSSMPSVGDQFSSKSTMGRVEADEVAMGLVSKGKREEELRDYRKASSYYEQACSYFLLAIKGEPDSIIKQSLNDKAKIYLERVEKLKPYVQHQLQLAAQQQQQQQQQLAQQQQQQQQSNFPTLPNINNFGGNISYWWHHFQMYHLLHLHHLHYLDSQPLSIIIIIIIIIYQLVQLEICLVVWEEWDCAKFMDDVKRQEREIRSFVWAMRNQLDVLERKLTKDYSKQSTYLESRLQSDYLQLDYLNRLVKTVTVNHGYDSNFDDMQQLLKQYQDQQQGASTTTTTTTATTANVAEQVELDNPKPFSLKEMRSVNDLKARVQQFQEFQDFLYRMESKEFVPTAKTNRHLDLEIERVFKVSQRDPFTKLSFTTTSPNYLAQFKENLDSLYTLEQKLVKSDDEEEKSRLFEEDQIEAQETLAVMASQPFKEIYLKSKDDNSSFCIFDIETKTLLEHINLVFKQKRERGQLVSFQRRYIYMFGGRGKGSESTWERFNVEKQIIDQDGELGHVQGEWIVTCTDNLRYIYLLSTVNRDGMIERFDTQTEKFETLGKVLYLPSGGTTQGFSFLYYFNGSILIKHEDVKYMESFDLKTKKSSIYHKSTDKPFRCSSQGVFDEKQYIYTYGYTNKVLQRFDINTRMVETVYSDPTNVHCFNTHPFIYCQATNTIYFATRKSIRSYNLTTNQFSMLYSTTEDKLSIYCCGI
ncbi:hypothetical protein DFA_09950 [Cavenderia fasciculata]|uniref:MIT domain-containing protein n=1 Tax=Cavenderia fasciculata TaxID=261658 RepID=F4Q8V7_CACFS|nr:uncharacterized protein DFA_09950 [Cavenderia fasciculata]EGG15126.1 hypothetical protein DFA_09950 [Cavenderia fasciculata]|eukprot:XP_004351846.1 hypothetical protein DFA_09950 [Cavenderia fasciculata]